MIKRLYDGNTYNILFFIMRDGSSLLYNNITVASRYTIYYVDKKINIIKIRLWLLKFYFRNKYIIILYGTYTNFVQRIHSK